MGYGKVKPPKKSKELIDIDRARIAEICKRQLHLHLQVSSFTKEHSTFGILAEGMKRLLTWSRYISIWAINKGILWYNLDINRTT